jgi:aspartyl-tRNA(Asn)/glutamyl-tRNA(Gln) amidotransferase subunit C
MRISRREVEQIASLARLDLRGGELDGLAHDLGSILEHMEALVDVDVGGTQPMEGVSEHTAPFREDNPGADPLRLPLERIAPAMEEGFFVVPRLAALDADAFSAEGNSA